MDDNVLMNNFTYHAPNSDSMIQDYTDIRQEGLAFSRLINDLVPDSREKSHALTKIEEAVMWANAGIARSA